MPRTGDFPDENPPSNDKPEAQGFPRTRSGNRITGSGEEPWRPAPDGAAEGRVHLATSAEGFHYGLQIRDTQSFALCDIYGPIDLRNADGSLRWSPAYPAMDAARAEGYAALARAWRGMEYIPDWPAASDDAPASREQARDHEPDDGMDI